MELKRAALPEVESSDDYSAAPEALRPGHRVRLLIDGKQTFTTMLEAIAAARDYILLETYILRADGIGERFAEALIERARAGVDVWLIYDGFGSLWLPSSFVERLQDAGVHTLEYRPVRRGKWTWKRWLRRDHRKILVVDGRLGFVGGINIGDEYSPREWGGKHWRDTHATFLGPVVGDMISLFRSTWNARADSPLRRLAIPETVSGGDERAQLLYSDDRGRRSGIRRHIVHAIRQARQRILVSNAYFLPDPGLRRALARAAQRGVDVRILVPGHSDVRSVQWAGEHTFRYLLRRGVRIYQWQDTHMHAKTITIDDQYAMIGSYNLDYMSLFWNREVVAEILGTDTPSALASQFAVDIDRSLEIQSEQWSRRSWLVRLRSWWFYRFRRFL